MSVTYSEEFANFIENVTKNKDFLVSIKPAILSDASYQLKWEGGREGGEGRGGREGGEEKREGRERRKGRREEWREGRKGEIIHSLNYNGENSSGWPDYHSPVPGLV